MEAKSFLTRRTMSVSIESQNFNTITAKNREIMNAINNRNPSSLLQMSFARTSISPIRSTDDKSDSSMQLLLLKKTIDHQRLTMGKGDNTLSTLRQELKILELEEVKREFWDRQNKQKIKQLQHEIEIAIENQIIESNNQEIYYHLLKRMKKTKIFLEIRSFALNENIINSDFVLSTEVKKHLISKEAASQAMNTFKEFKESIVVETTEGTNQIYELQRSIENSKTVADRRDAWKKHQETMYEAAIIDDRSAKSLKMKEGLALHKLWYKVLTRIYERKKEKSKNLEDAFQNVKIFTGIPEIGMVVENFLTKEQTYAELMNTVRKKEVECSNYKKKIDEMQAAVNNFANRDVGEGDSVEEMKGLQQDKIRDLLELSQKKFAIENTTSKLKTWLKLMIRKFNNILGLPFIGLPNDQSLDFYMQEVKKICSSGITENTSGQSLGLRIEDKRKMAVRSAIKSLSKVPHNIQ